VSPSSSQEPASPGDSELVLAARSGDARAFRTLYERHAPRIYGVLAAATRDRTVAGDLLQEVFLQAHKNLGQLREPGRLREWLFAITMNQVRAHAGGQERERALRQTYQPERIREEPGEAERPLLRELRIEAVRQAIAAVKDPKERLLLERYYGAAEQPTTRALASELSLPASTVTVTLMRARARIARQLMGQLATLGEPT
jgi:RNA polymerase sigma factor (sigma-70 family)